MGLGIAAYDLLPARDEVCLCSDAIPGHHVSLSLDGKHLVNFNDEDHVSLIKNYIIYIL